jgi:hypothetical protein
VGMLKSNDAGLSWSYFTNSLPQGLMWKNMDVCGILYRQSRDPPIPGLGQHLGAIAPCAWLTGESERPPGQVPRGGHRRRQPAVRGAVLGGSLV